MNRLLSLVIIFSLLSLTQIFAQQDFTRVFSLPTETWEVGGFGGLVAGVDFDGDGKTEIYACNTNFIDRDEELVPRLYKFEWSGTEWEMVWMTDTNIPLQNTWPGFTWGDLDKDGKPEIIWAPTNFLSFGSTPNPNPPRILIYEYPGDGTDAMGVFDGVGGYLPNAYTTIVDENNTEVRPIKLVIEDIDEDGDDEIIFADRRAGTGDYHFGVISVSDVPDFADGTEDWTIEAKGLDFPSLVGTGNKWDIAVLDNYIYLWNASETRSIYAIRYQGGIWETLPVQTGIGDNSFKSAQVVDLDNDGNKEIVVGSYYTTASGGAKVYLHKQVADT
ncbi:MAG: VCBS repeat-containing protein, partial [Ignavibacteriaceae bacterium]|nr:VCBS repeat-containing protein [Ignavibacteriaceae bacterium]